MAKDFPASIQQTLNRSSKNDSETGHRGKSKRETFHEEQVPSKLRCGKADISETVKITLFVIATSMAVSLAMSAVDTLGTLHPQSVIADSPKHLSDALTLVGQKDDAAFDRMVACDAAMICDTEMQVVVDQSTQDWIKFHVKELPELTFYTVPSYIDFKQTGESASLTGISHGP